jgi:hypothetical protein
MAEMLKAANDAYDEWLRQQHDLDKLDRVLLLAGFRSGIDFHD